MNKVGVYMGKRDFVDHCEFVDPVDGVVLIDPEQVKGKKVYVMLSCMFRYGRDDMDVLGMAFRRDIFLCSRQVYPPLQDKERSIHTKVQDKILRKLGDNAYPFFFEGSFDLSQCILGFEDYALLKILVEMRDTVPSGTSLKKVYTLCPLLDNNRERLGLALDGKLKHEDTNLASSSIVKDEVLKEILGMLVAYRVVVKSNAAGIVGSSEVAVEVPFKLMHPKPYPESEDTTDLVFEEFKRSYLKGVIGDDDESPAEP
ncbi:arrestin red cell-like [Sinocyclocheilus rhinocerous]|uniref:arrestin red cell-like n=1 Tax=Sinocyclocheilus rhinocerous TaxID=307959 RepID=UPI0007B9B482|nr:PREDICTED: arrestin red cell-like [Sinocyclocheilus rhinocerous]